MPVQLRVLLVCLTGHATEQDRLSIIIADLCCHHLERPALMTTRRPHMPGVDRHGNRFRRCRRPWRFRPRHGLPFDTHPNTRGPASDRLVPWKVSTEREELGQKPPGAAIWQPGPHLRQCPLVFGGAAVWQEFRCRAKCRPRRDRASAGLEARCWHLDRAEQRIQPPGARVFQRAEAPTTRAAAAQCAVLRHPALNQVPLHARQQGLAVVQRQAERIEWRMRVGAATSGNFVGLLRSISAVQLDRHPPFHSRPRSSRYRS